MANLRSPADAAGLLKASRAAGGSRGPAQRAADAGTSHSVDRVRLRVAQPARCMVRTAPCMVRCYCASGCESLTGDQHGQALRLCPAAANGWR